ncbi:DinB family protein [Sciscionella sediminilitoris]|uniref:DinB family protein n=1 Tax=Sciscionella sediminilitoris TaxID=1445613 RepID=UPI000ADF7D99|nr:DinB family protein [Sciscionella sp. SE31]
MIGPALDDTAPDERTGLEAFLDEQRLELVTRVSGVSEEQARRALVPSATTLGGLVKHLTWVEQVWFSLHTARVPRERWPWPWPQEDHPDAGFRMTPDETVPGLLEAYRTECLRSKENAARHSLDAVFPDERFGSQVSLRWIYLHMIEETARHAGHADILREQLDGVRGEP